jgi:excisionase family DNA binding protein
VLTLADMTPAKSNVPNDPEVLSPGEVCRLLHISRSTLPAWRDTGQLRGTQTPGGHWRYFADSPAVVHMREAAKLRPEHVVPVGQLTLDGDQ